MIALSTGSLYTYGLARVFALAAETGYDGVEVLVDGRRDSRDAAYLRRLSSEFALPIVALHSPFVRDIPQWPPDSLSRLRHTVGLAQALEVPLVVAHLPSRLYTVHVGLDFLKQARFRLPLPFPRRGPWYRFLREGGLQHLCSNTGVKIALENMPAQRFAGLTVNGFWFNRLEDLAGFPHLCLDTTHLGSWGLDPIEAYARLAGRVGHVHLSNFDGREHRAPHQGKLPLDRFLRRLARDGYTGAVSVECSPEALGAEKEGKCRRAVAGALSFCRDNLTRRRP